jgi:hypothetical protein
MWVLRLSPLSVTQRTCGRLASLGRLYKRSADLLGFGELATPTRARADGSIWAAPWVVPAAGEQTALVQTNYGLVPIGWVQSALRVLDDAPNQRNGAPRRGSASMSRSRRVPRTYGRVMRSWCSPDSTCRPATS